MNPGRLRYRVVLQEPAQSVADAYGARTIEWTTIATVWADIEEGGASDLERNRKTESEGTVTIRLRYRSDITTDWRVVYGQRTFYVESVARDPRQRIVVLRCGEQP
ncbi:MAG: phage head closure protein [Planctomycetota bacterium]